MTETRKAAIAARLAGEQPSTIRSAAHLIGSSRWNTLQRATPTPAASDLAGYLLWRIARMLLEYADDREAESCSQALRWFRALDEGA